MSNFDGTTWVVAPVRRSTRIRSSVHMKSMPASRAISSTLAGVTLTVTS
jgi:hypothetical protein